MRFHSKFWGHLFIKEGSLICNFFFSCGDFPNNNASCHAFGIIGKSLRVFALRLFCNVPNYNLSRSFLISNLINKCIKNINR
jgi:hypothetical protein